MRILHLYASNAPSVITDYVKMLCEQMGQETENESTTAVQEALQMLRDRHYDLLHIHGCWQYAAYRAVRQAQRRGTRIIVTPHGQLEPWVMKQGYWKEKLPKRLLFQRSIIQKAYAVVVQGNMEEECMTKLGWNRRIVIIRNCLITNTINAQEMARQTWLVYRKIMDSNTLALMADSTKTTLRQLLKVGITGDERWLGESFVTITDHNQWRMLYCYVHQEQVAETVRRGLRILRADTPDFDIQQMPCFMPDGYETPKTIEEAIGMQYATENDRLMATFRHLRRLTMHHRLTLSHLVELDKELRNHDTAEDQLCDALRERHLYKFARRIMQLTNDLTGLDEGHMPMPPLDDRLSRHMRKYIDNHLKI
jgi:hypothetical protein